MKKITFALFSILVFNSCDEFLIEKNIVGNYCIYKSEGSEGAYLAHKEDNQKGYSGIIEATVFAAGYNENYIIVKQHPRSFPNPPNKKITNYFILQNKKSMDWETKNGLIGPLTLQEFNEKRKELNIPNDVTFTTVIKDLE